MTLTQRTADGAAPDVTGLLRGLNTLPTEAPFQVTGPGEVRGLTGDAHAAVAAALLALRGGSYRVGIGVGAVSLTRVTDPEGRAAVTADGPGMVFGREAAGRSGHRAMVRVCAANAQAAAQAEAVLALVGRLVSERSAAEWRVVDLLTPGARGQQKAVAGRLGITPQAVSKAVVRSLWHEEWQARPAAATLLEHCAAAGP